MNHQINEFIDSFIGKKFLPKLPLEQVSCLDDSDLESVVMRYAHGDCHIWSLALFEKDQRLSIYGVFADKQLIHSCVSNSESFFDANGVQTQIELMAAWGFVDCQELHLVQMTYDELFALVSPDQEEILEADDNMEFWLNKTKQYLIS